MRKFNFSAGPAVLPLPVLEEVRDTLVDYRGNGLSLLECSHRSKMYEDVHNETISLFRELLGLPESHKVIFLGGGATLQFSMVPMNFLTPGKACDIVVSGAWAKKALSDAKKIGDVKVVFDGAETKYTTLPKSESIYTPDAAYVHITSNETIGGLQWKTFPDTGDVPLIADMSSDIMSTPLPVEKFSMIYAGAQKNLGTSGVAAAIIHEKLLERCPKSLTAYLNYGIHAEKNSLYNTPPVFSIYIMMLVLRWVKAQGGVAKMRDLSSRKAGAIYQVIDSSGGFYSCPVEKESRSVMNVIFRLPSEELDMKFLEEAEALDMIGLKGYRDAGGCRASLYNAMPLEGALTLAGFMKDFAAANG